MLTPEDARLLDGADRLLASVGWDRRRIDGYVAVRGPGSFTGVRVGLGTIRGLALAAGRPCAGIVSLEALAHAHGLAGDFAAQITGEIALTAGDIADFLPHAYRDLADIRWR